MKFPVSMPISVCAIALICLFNYQCGYKAAPSPYFDETERFSDEIYRRADEKAVQAPMKESNIFLRELPQEIEEDSTSSQIPKTDPTAPSHSQPRKLKK